MKIRLLSLITGMAFLWTITACNVNVNDGTSGSNPNLIPLDSGTTITTHTEEHTESHAGFEVKGEMNSESHTTIHSTTTVGKALTLAQQVEQWSLEIFPEYKVVEMDPMEAYPKYKTAQETIFSRLRMKNPISNAYGKAVYPRLLIKAYRFAAPTALTKEVEAWLNTLGSATQGIQLGQAVDAVKSPPLLCAVVNNDFLVVQGGCVYDGAEWTATKALFFKTLETQGAIYTFEVQCKGGALVYHAGGES
jgi:hypothetical protein